MMFHEVNTFLEQQSGQDYQNLKPPPLMLSFSHYTSYSQGNHYPFIFFLQ